MAEDHLSGTAIVMSTPIRSFAKVGCNEDIAITLLFSVPLEYEKKEHGTIDLGVRQS
ncbi:hypothetical protein [Bacillus stercoris]|uniref:hypothetical protein n=1 Tax=Bacillus stercoris TaxID=2054641 RepID=UPI002DD1FC47|nr:hypothetical protein [Bacillus stercoris]